MHKFVCYEDFGAVGDGFAEDFTAIKMAHDYANEKGLPVMAKPGAKYYIRDTRIDGQITKITIKTDTVWDDAEFVIDDRDINYFTAREMATSHVIEVVSDYEAEKLEDRAVLDRILADGLRQGTTKVNLGRDYPVMIIPYNSYDRVYKRRGTGGFLGQYMHEVIVLDKDGNIDPTTPVMFNYDHLDYITVIRLDIKPITIKGGTFTTRASRVNAQITDENGKKREAGYFSRGIDVKRSFTTVDGLKHYVTDEVTPKEFVLKDMHSPHYFGFFCGSNANGILFKNCVMTGRRYYHLQGTYDFTATNVNKIVLEGCVQHNFWVTYNEETDVVAPAGRDDEGSVTSMCWPTIAGKRFKLHWGLGGTNFCKNMEYINSLLSRFDAHAGLYNGKIINSTVNFMSITGNGDFTVENVNWYSEGAGRHSSPMIYLRGDYGSTWEGKITVKNLNAYVHTSDKSHLFYHGYANWNYGYRTYMPSISIDGLRLFDIDTYEPVADDYQIEMLQESVTAEPALHLENTFATAPWMPYADDDGDGIVDGTDVPYSADKVAENRSGIQLTDSRKNVNPVVPPEYVKITNARNYTVNIPKTYSTERNIPDMDGKANEGFFGTTKFIYGDGDEEFYQGTNHENTKTFNFFEF